MPRSIAAEQARTELNQVQIFADTYDEVKEVENKCKRGIKMIMESN